MAEGKSFDRRTGSSTTLFISQVDEMNLSAGREGYVMKYVLKINKDLTIYIRDQDAILKLIECLEEWKNV